MAEPGIDKVMVSEKQPFAIREGDHVILRRGSLMTTCHVLPSKKVWFKKMKFQLDNAIGCSYGSTFKINGTSLELAPHSIMLNDEDERNDDDDARDNRGLNDDGKSQKLSKDDIEVLKGKGLSGEEIVDQIIENSQTFKNKNEYSKIKYLKKKQQKYSKYISVLKPTTRLLVEMYHSQGCLKILGLRMDSLAQMLTMSNVYSGGKFIVVDSCLGLVTGAVLERLGGLGKLINVFIGCPPQYPALNLFNFTDEQQKCLNWINVNDAVNTDEGRGDGEMEVDGSSRDLKVLKKEEESLRDQRRKQRLLSKEEALEILQQRNMDGIIMACKHHPVNILRALIPFLALSRPFVVFSPYQQPLVECWIKLKEDRNILMMNICETFCRHYQVLSNRTHPTISGSGCSGFILFGIKAEVNIQKAKN